jgi:hypothetical protein
VTGVPKYENANGRASVSLYSSSESVGTVESVSTGIGVMEAKESHAPDIIVTV